MSRKVAVVIPFFQKKPGILIKAVKSALWQHTSADIRVLIVDDASPVSARSEIAALSPEQADRITIIEQANGGPAAARNNALRNVPAGTEFVAFLDSDDEWIPEHIENAVQVLEAGNDLYFSDHYQLNQNVSAFARAGRIDIEKHPMIGGAAHLHRYHGDMFEQILGGNIIGTSTVVYRYAKFPALRFREEFVYAGEDYLFWLELAQATDKIGFSQLCECTYGEGVNIFAGSGWGTEKSLIRLHHEMKYKKALPRLFALSADQNRRNCAAVRVLRQSFVADMLHRLRHRKPVERNTIIAHARIDPQSFIFFIPLVIRMAIRRR